MTVDGVLSRQPILAFFKSCILIGCNTQPFLYIYRLYVIECHTILLMPDITRGQRERVIALSHHTSKTHREIATNLGMCQSTVTRIINHYKRTGSVKTLRKGKCGPVAKVRNCGKRYIIRESVKDPRKTASEIQKSAGISAAHVSLRTIQRILRKGGRRCYRSKKVHMLDHAKKQRRCDWAKRHMQISQEEWNTVRQIGDFFVGLFFFLFVSIHCLARSSLQMKQWWR